MPFPLLDDTIRLTRLTPPQGPVSMVLDTDTYNEIDDQFAVVHALLSRPSLDVQAIYAAPFFNERSTGPADGMQRSYDEILRLLNRLNHPHDEFAYRGSPGYLPGPLHPLPSPAAEDLVRRAMTPRPAPLYVAAIGAITNIASAILLEPRIVEHIVVVWLAGHPHTWPTADEFNLGQDLHASRVILDSGVPLVQIPCINVAEHLRTTLPEIERFVRGRGPIGDYLHDTYKAYFPDHFARSKVIWDISAIAWLLNPAWVPTILTHSPILTDHKTWSLDPSRHLMRVATHLDRDAIFGDLFRKLPAP